MAHKRRRAKARYNVSKEFIELMEEFQKLFYYGCEVDRWLPEIMMYPFISLEWKNIPTWYRIIAPPGSGKTAHISIMADYYLSYAIDEFTPKSFISGFRGHDGQDISTLPQLDGKVLVILDESTMMEQRQEDRNAVQSLLRKAYDGVVSKAFGNIKGKVTHKAYFNILSAATPQIDRYFLYNQALGERYINFRLQIPSRILLTKRAYNNQMRGYHQKHDKLQKKMWRFLRSLPVAAIPDITIDNYTKDLFINCANFIAEVRTHVSRDITGKHITTLTQPEAAGRLVQQMVQVAVSGAIVRGYNKVKPLQVSIAVYIALCSMPAVTAFVLYHIWRYTQESSTQWFSVQKIVLQTAIGRATIARVLEDLAIHRVLQIRKHDIVRGFEYSLSDNSARIIKDTDLFAYYKPPTGNVVTEKRKDRATGHKTRKIKPTKIKKGVEHGETTSKTRT